MRYKKFNEMHTNEKLHLLIPITEEIKEVLLVKIEVWKKNPNYYFLTFLKPVNKPDIITDDRLLEAHKTLGTNVTERIVIPHSLSMVLLNTQPPTVIATSKEEILEWKKRTS